MIFVCIRFYYVSVDNLVQTNRKKAMTRSHGFAFEIGNYSFFDA